MKRKKLLLAALAAIICGAANSQTITTYAGNGTYSLDTTTCPADGGQATATTINMPGVLKIDASGNLYFVTWGAYWGCQHLKKISTSGIVSNVAGNGSFFVHSGDGGPAVAAGFNTLNNFCLDQAGNIYIMEIGGSSSATWLRKVNTSGIVSKIAGGDTSLYTGDGGPATAAGFDGFDVATDLAGNIYFSDVSNNRIRKINTAGIISTVAGNGTPGYTGDGGPATNAELDLPQYITIDVSGNIYFTDQSPSAIIRKITPTGIISTIPIVPAIASAHVVGLACDNSGNLYVSDAQSNVVRKISSSGVSTVVAGNVNMAGFYGDGGAATAASLNSPKGIAIDAAGNLYIGDNGNYRIRKVSSHATGIDMNGADNSTMRIWPEPSNGAFSVYVPSENEEHVAVVITNTLGQVVKEISAVTNRELQIKMDAVPGVYFINSTTGQQHFSSRVVIK